MKHDRALVIILTGIGVLVIATLVLFFSRRGDNQEYVADDTPEGIVRNYLLALNLSDFEKAYSYLGAPDNKPGLAEFQSDMIALKSEFGRIYIRLGEVDQTDTVAAVSLTINHPGSGPFDGGWDENTRVQLIKDASGAWKITSVPYPFWDPGWTIQKQIAP